MSKKRIRIHPVLLLLTGASLISFSGVFVNISQVPPTISGFYRVFFGSLFLIAACLVRKEFKQRTLKKNGLAIALGLLFALDLWAWHKSICYIGPGLATILGNCQVFILSVVGFFAFKEAVRFKFILSVPLAFLGLFLIIGVDIDQLSRQYVSGLILGFATALFYSMFLLLLRYIQSDEDDFSLFYYLMVLSMACAVFLGGSALISGDSFRIPNPVSLLSLLGLGIFSQAIAWVMISYALPKVKASHAGLILLLQPALSFVWDVAFFQRQTGWIGWTGVVIVLAAIYLGMAGEREVH